MSVAGGLAAHRPAERLAGCGRAWPTNRCIIDAMLPVDQTLDIRGEVCPYTYVKARLALEEMQAGQVLRVLVDYEPATRSVPRSVRLHGDEVLSVDAIGTGEWAIWVRKSGEAARPEAIR